MDIKLYYSRFVFTGGNTIQYSVTFMDMGHLPVACRMLSISDGVKVLYQGETNKPISVNAAYVLLLDYLNKSHIDEKPKLEDGVDSAQVDS